MINYYKFKSNLYKKNGGKMASIVKRDTNRFKELLDGIELQNLAVGKKTHMVKFSLKEGKVLPNHRHIQEQTGYMIRGKMVLTIGGEDYIVETGDSWSIEPNVLHSAKIIEDSEVIEVFSPLREDYLD